MTPENFTYWLQGFAEISESKGLSEKQWMIVQDHLKLVFKKETPVYPKIDLPKELEKVIKKDPFAPYPRIPMPYDGPYEGPKKAKPLEVTC